MLSDDIFKNTQRILILAFLYKGEHSFMEIHAMTGTYNTSMTKNLVEPMEEKGYLESYKVDKGKRQATIYRLSDQGLDAMDSFVDTLRDLMRGG